MELKIGEKKFKLDYTFNSFRHMDEIDFGELENIDSKPFKIIGFTEEMLLGALNYSPNNVFSADEAAMVLNEYMDDGGNLAELVENLTKLMEESQFFKNLQMTK